MKKRLKNIIKVKNREKKEEAEKEKQRKIVREREYE